MATVPAKAVVNAIDDLGTGAGTAIFIRAHAIIVGDDGHVFDLSSTASVNEGTTLGAIQNAIHDAIVADALTVITPTAPQGYAIVPNRMLIMAFNRI